MLLSFLLLLSVLFTLLLLVVMQDLDQIYFLSGVKLLTSDIICRRWVYPIHLSIFGSIVLYILIVIILSLVEGTDLFQMGEWMFQEPSFYFGLVLTIVVCLLPELLVSYIKRTYYPELSDIIEEKDVLNRHQSSKDEKFTEGWIELARRSRAITKLDKV